MKIMGEAKRCTRCIVPESFPGVSFDEGGVCSLCTGHRPPTVLGEDRLREVLTAQKGEDYDCVVPLSGGKDSTWILYYATELLGLRTIAVNYDSGFQAPLAAENARKACQVLGVPLVVVKANRDTQLRMLKQAVLVSEIIGAFFGTCMNCEVNIRTAAINTARTHKVPAILYGSSEIEDIGNHRFLGPREFVRRIPLRRLPRFTAHVALYSIYSIRQRIEMGVPLGQRFLPFGNVPFPRGTPHVVYYFQYVAWDSLDKVGLLQDRLGWRAPADQEQRFDCALHCLANHRWTQDTGISMDGYTYSTMVRDERIERKDVLRKEALIQETFWDECADVYREIGLEDHTLPGGFTRPGE
jgi:hypothetical protein